MKKPAVKSAPAEKSKPAKRSVDEYLASMAEPARSTLNKVRDTIRSAVPRQTQEVISYGIPAFKYKKVLVWYAGFSDHCSLFPTAAVIARLKDELKPYRVSKGTIQFPVDQPMSAVLLRKIVKIRLALLENKN